MTTQDTYTSDTSDWVNRPRESRRETLSSSSNNANRSVGFRLGVSRNYGFGLSDPSLRPAILD